MNRAVVACFLQYILLNASLIWRKTRDVYFLSIFSAHQDATYFDVLSYDLISLNPNCRSGKRLLDYKKKVKDKFLNNLPKISSSQIGNTTWI